MLLQGMIFLPEVAVEWEGEALKAQGKRSPVVITRFGIVLGEKGGALGQMIPLFKKFVGGPIGNGRQWFSWVHIKDLAEAFVFLLKTSGNFRPCEPVFPKPVAETRIWQRPWEKLFTALLFMPAPGFMIKLVLGEFGSVILEGQRVIPRRLLDSGFVFEYPDIDKALQNLMPR